MVTLVLCVYSALWSNKLSALEPQWFQDMGMLTVAYVAMRAYIYYGHIGRVMQAMCEAWGQQ